MLRAALRGRCVLRLPPRVPRSRMVRPDFLSRRTSPMASKSPWPRTATTCGRWLLPSGPPEPWHSTVSPISGSGGTPLPPRRGGIRAVEEAAVGAANPFQRLIRPPTLRKHSRSPSPEPPPNEPIPAHGQTNLSQGAGVRPRGQSGLSQVSSPVPPCRSQLRDPTNQTYGTTGSHTALDCSDERKMV